MRQLFFLAESLNSDIGTSISQYATLTAAFEPDDAIETAWTGNIYQASVVRDSNYDSASEGEVFPRSLLFDFGY